MTKKKDSVALFEVIQKARRSERNMAVPEWMGRQEGVPAAAAGSASQPGAAEAAPVGGAVERTFAIIGDRLRISLSHAGGVVAAAVVLLLVGGGFALGWWGGASWSRAAGPGPLADKTPLGRHVVRGKGRGKGKAPVPPAGDQRQSGKYYLVIQSLGGVAQTDLTAAGQIAAFCKAQSEGATIARYTDRAGRQRYVVWSLRPFDSANSKDARDYALLIEELGRKYMQAGGRYNFQQRVRAGAKLDPLLLPAP